ncbi:MAG: low molecular weight protein-tyrosine-phosphatase [Gammaproteobacteria bacterium]
MGNICRSPTAVGVLRHLLQQEAPDLDVAVDSAGTHAYHAGQPPDRRAQAAAKARGIDLSELRARAIADEDFAAYDVILAMDRDNHALLVERCPPEYVGRVRMLMEFAGRGAPRDVPDPYYGSANGFERVLDLVEAACRGLLADLRRRSTV